MKTSLDCIPCFLRQTLEATRYVSGDPSVHERILREMLRSLAKFDFDQSPPVVGQWVHRKLRQLTGNNDPYKPAKDRFNRFVLDLLPELRSMVSASSDRLKTSVRLAIAGNIVDLGAKAGLTENQVQLSITGSMSEPLHGDFEGFRSEINKASKILYLADNAGEIVFDRLLIEELPVERVIVAVRGGPVINDATLDDAYAAGIHEIVRVIDNGSDAPGTILADCSAEFQRHFKEADLIIAKGQGNYETLSDEPANIFFLFKIKCSVTGSHLGLEPETNVLQRALKTRR